MLSKYDGAVPLTFKKAYILSMDNSLLIPELQRLKLLHSSMACSKCEIAMTMIEHGHFAQDGHCWWCNRTSCKRRVSIRTDSYFARSHLSLGSCFMIIFCYLKYGKMLQKDMADILEVSEMAMTDWGNYIRETISSYFLQNPLKLGANSPVQIDESLFGGRCKYHRGDHSQHMQSWVFGMVEEETRLCVFWTVDNRNAATLTSIIEEHVVPGATIKSDQWSAYSSLGQLGFDHLTVNHSLSFVSETGVHTQLIESMWSQIKSTLKVRRGTAKQHLPGYLDFYSFSCLARYKNQTPFKAFLELIKVGHCF